MEKSSQQNPSFGQGLELAIIAAKAIASAAKKNKASDEIIQKIVGKPGAVFEFFEKLLAEAIEEKKNSILSLISGHEKLMIEASDGKAYIFDAKNIFRAGIDDDFKKWGLDKPGSATEQILVDVSEMVDDGTFVQIFTKISNDLEKLVMTQAQIIRFCEKYPTWLRQEGCATFFLTKMGGEYFVVNVRVYSGGLCVSVYRLGLDFVFRGQCRGRVVSPQLMPSVA